VGQPLRRSDAGLDPGGGVANTWSIPAGLVGLPEAVHQWAALDCRGPAHRVDPVVRVGQPRPEIQFVPQHIAGLPLPVRHQVPGTGGLGPHQLAVQHEALTKVDTLQFESALQLWVNMVKDGSASKSVLNWGQDPDLTQQFMNGHAAMMVNGPWIFPELNAKGWKYNDQYASCPFPPIRPARPWSRRSAARPSIWAPAARPSSRSSPGNGWRACSRRRP
jgi:extracellular solute-binding protein